MRKFERSVFSTNPLFVHFSLVLEKTIVFQQNQKLIEKMFNVRINSQYYSGKVC